MVITNIELRDKLLHIKDIIPAEDAKVIDLVMNRLHILEPDERAEWLIERNWNGEVRDYTCPYGGNYQGYLSTYCEECGSQLLYY